MEGCTAGDAGPVATIAAPELGSTVEFVDSGCRTGLRRDGDPPERRRPLDVADCPVIVVPEARP